MFDAAKLRVRGRAARCPFCHDECHESDRQVACADCSAAHHRACWREGRGCSTCRSARAKDPLGSDPLAGGPRRARPQSWPTPAPSRFTDVPWRLRRRLLDALGEGEELLWWAQPGAAGLTLSLLANLYLFTGGRRARPSTSARSTR